MTHKFASTRERGPHSKATRTQFELPRNRNFLKNNTARTPLCMQNTYGYAATSQALNARHTHVQGKAMQGGSNDLHPNATRAHHGVHGKHRTHAALSTTEWRLDKRSFAPTLCIQTISIARATTRTCDRGAASPSTGARGSNRFQIKFIISQLALVACSCAAPCFPLYVRDKQAYHGPKSNQRTQQRGKRETGGATALGE